MDEIEITDHVFPTAEEDINVAKLVPDTPQTRSASYRLDYTDRDFPVRGSAVSYFNS